MIGYEILLASTIEQLNDERLADWLVEKHKESNVSRSFFINFGLIGRKIPRVPIDPGHQVLQNLKEINPGFQKEHWTLDDFCRLSLLLSLDPALNKEQIATLLASADMREQIIIYRSMPYLPNASEFVWLAIDGIRTNMVDVFDAIALDNIYPYQYFPEDAWNQMVLKAIFMERPMFRIFGLDKRRSEKLAEILHDFVHERWSAGRMVTPELWRLVSGHISQPILEDLKKVVQEDTLLAKEAATKAMEDSNDPVVLGWLANNGIPRSKHSWDEIGKLIADRK